MYNTKHIFSVIALAAFLAIGIYLLVSPDEPADSVTSSDTDDSVESGLVIIEGSDSAEEDSLYAVAVDDPVSAPLSYTVFSASDDEFTVCWDDAVLSQEIEADIVNSIDLFTSEDYRVSFLLYDLESGQGFSYHSTDSYYSASAIKGPYVTCIAETFPDSVAELDVMLEDIIQVSNNEAYSALWDIYGTEAFESWTSEAGCSDMDLSGLYTDITARDMALMWVRMYDYFTSDNPDAEWISGLYTDTINSCIAETLGDTYVVYSKAGWISEDEYYNVQNDAGIVMSDTPYVFVVLSDAYEHMDLLDQLVSSADHAHTYLAENISQ